MRYPAVRLETLAASKPYALVGGPFGSKLTSADYVEDGIPVIRGSNLNNGRHIGENDFVYVTEEKMRKDLFGNLAGRGDIVFTQRGTLGQVALIPLNSRFETYVISQSQMKLSVDPEKAEARFVYYYFSSSEAVQKIATQNSSSGVPHINLTTLRNFLVPLPELEEQRRIADLLSTYDDMIENNQRRIELLEESARHLFKEWFVRLRYPGHEHDKIVDGVPNGWERKALGDVLALRYGKALQEEKRELGEVCVYGSSGEVGTHSAKLVPGPGIVVGRKGNVGSVFWVDGDFWPIDTVYFVESEKVNLFTLHLLRSLSFQNSDAAVPGLNRDYAYSIKVIEPPETLKGGFEDFAKPLFAQRRGLQTQNSKLTQARDLLLPRLMDGRISV